MHQYEGLIIAVPDVLRKARMNDIRGHIHPDIIFNGRVRCVTEELDQVPATDVVGFEYRARRQSWAQHSVTELFHATALIPRDLETSTTTTTVFVEWNRDGVRTFRPERCCQIEFGFRASRRCSQQARRQ